MFGILLVTHDQLGEQLRHVAGTIVNHDIDHVHALSLEWEQDLEEARERIQESLAAMEDMDDGTIILTDMFGGTPTNVSLTFIDENEIDVLTGVNLPMLIKLLALQRESWSREKAVRIARDRGRQSIIIAREVLAGQEEQSEESE